MVQLTPVYLSVLNFRGHSQQQMVFRPQGPDTHTLLSSLCQIHIWSWGEIREYEKQWKIKKVEQNGSWLLWRRIEFRACTGVTRFEVNGLINFLSPRKTAAIWIFLSVIHLASMQEQKKQAPNDFTVRQHKLQCSWRGSLCVFIHKFLDAHH